MGHDHDCFFVAAKIVLQPLDRRNIKMVGRLVEEQDIRLAEKQLDKCQFCALAAGELT